MRAKQQRCTHARAQSLGALPVACALCTLALQESYLGSIANSWPWALPSACDKRNPLHTCWTPNEPLSAGLSSGAGRAIAQRRNGALKHDVRVARTIVNGEGALPMLSRVSERVNGCARDGERGGSERLGTSSLSAVSVITACPKRHTRPPDSH